MKSLPTLSRAVGDAALGQLSTATAKNIHDLPGRWEPIHNLPLRKATDWFRLENWTLGSRKEKRSPLARDFLAATSGSWTLPGRLALNSLLTVSANKNVILDNWVSQVPEVLDLTKDLSPQASQAAWVAAYLLLDKRTLKPQQTLVNVLRAAVASLPASDQPAAAVAVLGDALRLGSMAAWGGLHLGWKMNGRWFKVLMDAQGFAMDAGQQGHATDDASTKALAALRQWYPDPAAARAALKPVWLLALARCWTMCLGYGGVSPGKQSDFRTDLFDIYEAATPVSAPSPIPLPADTRSTWSEVALAFAVVENDRGPSGMGEHGPRVVNLAIKTLAHFNETLTPDAVQALLEVPESAWDPARCPPLLKSTIAEHLLATRLGASSSAPRSRHRL